MNDRELDRLLRAVCSGSDDAVRAAVAAAGPELLEEIMRTSPNDQSAPGGQHGPLEAGQPAVPGLVLDLPARSAPRPAPRRRRRLAQAGVAAGLAAAIVVPTYLTHGWARSGQRQVVVQPAADPGQPTAHISIGAPGWTVTAVSQSTAYDQDVTFGNGSRSLEIVRYPASQYAGYREDRASVSTPEKVPVLGLTGTLVRYSASDFAVMTPPQGKTFVEIRGGVGDRADFDGVLSQLRYASAREWDAAYGAGLVTPQREAAVAAQMLTGVPRPPGFAVADLPQGFTRDYYQYGARVAGQVVCGWLSSYLTADRTGDAPAKAAAQAALRSTHDWAVLKRMSSTGGYPDVVWQYADAVTRGTPVPGGSDKVTVASSYRQAFGCD